MAHSQARVPNGKSPMHDQLGRTFWKQESEGAELENSHAPGGMNVADTQLTETASEAASESIKACKLDDTWWPPGSAPQPPQGVSSAVGIPSKHRPSL